jgi:hypothetical protein
MLGRNPTPPNPSRRRLGEGGSLRRGRSCMAFLKPTARERQSAATAADPAKAGSVSLEEWSVGVNERSDGPKGLENLAQGLAGFSLGRRIFNTQPL